MLRELHLIAVPERCARKLPRIAADIPHYGARSGICMTLSEAVGETHALTCGGRASHGGFARDVLGLWASDASGAGVCIMAPLFETTKLSPTTRRRWQAVGTHVSAGFRLRRALIGATDSSASVRVRSSIPSNFRGTLRNAAVLADRTRSRSGPGDAEAALGLWHDVVEGRCSMVDLFESGSRRFILAVSNPAGTRDPHRLTKRETEVATYAALGETGKLIGSRLGVSASTVSGLLRDVMRKLRVRTQAELVGKLRSLRRRR
ncbi:MAG: helix-turn-helix transcriptional regulator [Deltaproteobacteria bacterium]|nr:helix-turn-helix transcriptional regulator [Deltaproteobacteria bacterium]MBT8465863.1 helix-turn-helix transcriptional regulator [Deltaproteobacteria bacterium]NNK07920.1 helix-turn-helix transcriptional regulator [Myxococcales bacterium]